MGQFGQDPRRHRFAVAPGREGIVSAGAGTVIGLEQQGSVLDTAALVAALLIALLVVIDRVMR